MAREVGERVAFHLARKGPACVLPQGPPESSLNFISDLSKGAPPGTLEKGGSHSSETRCWSSCPIRLRRRLGHRHTGWLSRNWEGHLQARKCPPCLRELPPSLSPPDSPRGPEGANGIYRLIHREIPPSISIHLMSVSWLIYSINVC